MAGRSRQALSALPTFADVRNLLGINGAMIAKVDLRVFLMGMAGMEADA